MSRRWKFKGSQKGRAVQSFGDFANSPYASDAVNAMSSTFLGMDVIDHIDTSKTIGFSVEQMYNCYGHYVPAKRNLKVGDNPDFEGLDGLITIDREDVDSAFLPFILGHEGFHAIQDRPQFSGLVPMYNNGVIYNSGIYRLGEKHDFVRAFKAMERACDVVSMCILWEMQRKGEFTHLYGELSQSQHMKDIATTIDDAAEWALDQGLRKRDVMDYAMFWGNMAGLWSEPYNDYLKKAAVKTYKDTQASIFFSTAPSLPTSPSVTFAQYALISDSYALKSWEPLKDIEAIEKHAQERKEKRHAQKIEAVREALVGAMERRSHPERFPDFQLP